MLTRPTLIEALTAAAGGQEAVRAAWLGGSDATGRADDLSDVDLVLLVCDDAVEPAFAAIESALAALSPLTARLRLPTPTWHGHDQAFYRLEEAPPWLLVDLVVIAESRPRDTWFLEVERHGTAVVLFDRDGSVRPVAMDRAAHEAKVRRRITDLRVRWNLFAPMVAKEARRGRAIDAASFYQAFVLRPVIDALRLLHCPDRFDFGARYLERDLPPDDHAAVVRLAFAADLPALERNIAEAEEIFDRAMTRLRAARSEPAGTAPG